MNEESDDLALSGLKHFRFCKRRWALVHIEQQWAENALTLEGQYLHEIVHDDGFTQSRGGVILSRGMPVRSGSLGVTGVCDMVELTADEGGIPIAGREGRYRVYPVEYKHGRPESTGADEWQLCAQALCLEEMFVIDIPEGAIYYGANRRRKRVELTSELRDQVKAAIGEMHRLFTRHETPRAKPKLACKSCSLREVCQPGLAKMRSAQEYVDNALREGMP